MNFNHVLGSAFFQSFIILVKKMTGHNGQNNKKSLGGTPI